MFRNFWEDMRNKVHNFLTSQFYTQEEIDDLLESQLNDYGTIVDDIYTLPSDATQRRQVFLSINDLILYLDDGAIPADYVFIVVIPNYTMGGDTGYKLFISTG